MYLLIRVKENNIRHNELVSKFKNKLVDHIKEKGYYWSKYNGCYIDDKNCGISGGSGSDYIIEKINELKT